MKQSKQQGFGVVAVLAIVVVIAVVGFVGWRLYDASQKPAGNNPSTQEPQTDPNEGYVVIREWGVRFKPVEGLTGVQYYKPHSSDNFFAFTTDELASADVNCAATSGYIALGGITRTAEASSTGKKHGPINGYYYYTQGPSAACSSRPNELEGLVVPKLLQSLDSLEAAK
jgi:hypothetical protein